MKRVQQLIRSVQTRDRQDSEGGAILVFTAIALVVIMGFVALTVDLGKAWIERRDDQAAADAAAMAAAIEIVRGAPTDAEIVAVAKDFVERNIGFPATDPGWATDCPAPTDGFVALAGTPCVSLKQAVTLANDVLIKVRIPDQRVPTSFASVLGIDTITVSAEAIARIEANPGALGALPFALPSGLSDGQEYCLGTPPSGQARSLCDGSSTGFFGTVDSPFFGAEADPWDTTGCQDQPTNLNERIRWNTALGIDHFIRIAPAGADPADGQDDCDASTNYPAQIPYALFADNGSLTQVSDGFIGNNQFGSLNRPGLLRQVNTDTRSVQYGTGSVALDDAPLWSYLVVPDGGWPVNDECRPENFDDEVGTELTANLIDCLEHGTPKFSNTLLSSPRFALAPVIDLTEAEIGLISTSTATNIIEFAPVFLQASWYNCSASACMDFETDNTDGFIAQVFEPGEGSAIGCIPQGTGCRNNVNLVIEGITALLLTDEDWLPDDFDNQFNDPGGFNVYMYR